LVDHLGKEELHHFTARLGLGEGFGALGFGNRSRWWEGAQTGSSSPGGAQMRLVALSWLCSPCAMATRLSESTVSISAPPGR